MTTDDISTGGYPCTVPYDAETRSRWLMPTVPLTEYAERQAKVRENMEAAGLDGILVVGNPADPASIAYLCNHQYTPTLSNNLYLLPLGSEPMLTTDAILHGEPMHSMVWNAWCDDLRPATKRSESPPGTVVDVVVDAIHERGLDSSRIGVVSLQTLSTAHMDELRRHLPDVVWTDGTHSVAQARMIKSDVEIAHLRRACEITALGLAEAISVIQPGVTEREVANAAHAAMFKAGAEDFAFDTAVSSGARAGLKHASPTDRALEPSDMIFLDMGCTIGGYHADLSRTVAVDPVDDVARRMFDASRKIFDAALAAVKPGNSVQDIYHAAERAAARAGFESDYMASGLGHGVGLALFELPILAPDDQTVLQPGMTFALEPMLVRYNKGTAVVEETVLVTADGAETLSSMSW